jgi:Tfp pilus assembly protein PilO
MTGRDRIVIMVVVVALILVAAWLEVVSPERKQVSQLNEQVTAAQAQLATAEGQVAHARAAQTQYAQAYASMVSLGKAVPPSQEVPSLIYQLSRATGQKHVSFAAISSSGSGASSSSSAAASTTAAATFSQLPFSFTFEGTYFDLERLFRQLTSFANLTKKGGIEVSGRLLTLQSVQLSPHASGSEGPTGGESKLTGSITATAYVLPAGQSVTGATGSSATPAASTGTSTSAPVAPAIVKVNP